MTLIITTIIIIIKQGADAHFLCTLATLGKGRLQKMSMSLATSAFVAHTVVKREQGSYRYLLATVGSMNERQVPGLNPAIESRMTRAEKTSSQAPGDGRPKFPF